MSSRWNELIQQSGDANAGAAVLRLATMAAALHRAEVAKLTRETDGSARSATVPRQRRAGDTEVAR